MNHSIHDTPEQSPGYLLWSISTLWRSKIEAVLKPLGLTHPQFVVLATLGWLTKDGDRVTQAAIGKLARLDPSTISQILRGLEKKKLIKRASSLDQRAKNPLLTTPGQSLLAKAMPAVEEEDSRFFKMLKTKELEDAMSIFQKLTRVW